jgi:hypothetical protein
MAVLARFESDLRTNGLVEEVPLRRRKSSVSKHPILSPGHLVVGYDHAIALYFGITSDPPSN